jgi:pyrroloquinoline-quinone synthase
MERYIENLLSEINYKHNPYFVNLQNGTFSKEDFIETQIQFYHAVTFFSRPMAFLAAKIPTPELRLNIIKKVWEEHGEGSIMNAHANTFLEFLKRIGSISVAEIEKKSVWPEVRIFNTALAGACALDNYLVGVAMMGIIERMFSDISNIIGTGILDRKWLSKENMIHYALHQELDIRHAADFFDILTAKWKEKHHRNQIEQGLMLGAYLFNDFYASLYQRRERRLIPTLD